MSQTMQRPVTKTVDQQPTLLDRTIEETVAIRQQTIGERAAKRLGIPPGKLLEMMRQIWKVSKGQDPLTDHELFVGLSMVAKYDLDPTCKEIYVTRGNDGKLMVVVGIDGWVKILDRTKHYDGFEQELHFDEAGNIEWIETKIYSTKRSKPTVYRAYWKEYQAVAGFMKGKIPIHMLRLFSLHHATRLFTPIGGHVRDESESFMMMAQESEPVRYSGSKSDALVKQMSARAEAAAEQQPAVEQQPEPTQEPAEQRQEPQQPARELTPEDITNDFDRCAKMADVMSCQKRLEADANGDAEKLRYIQTEADRRTVELQSKRGK